MLVGGEIRSVGEYYVLVYHTLCRRPPWGNKLACMLSHCEDIFGRHPSMHNMHTGNCEVVSLFLKSMYNYCTYALAGVYLYTCRCS